MLVKNALYPYRRSIESRNSDTIPVIKPLRSRDYYNIYREQLTHDANITFVPKYLDSYCNSNNEILAFHRKVVLEKEIKLKEFNFKVLRGILPCNYNLRNYFLFIYFFLRVIVMEMSGCVQVSGCVSICVLR